MNILFISFVSFILSFFAQAETVNNDIKPPAAVTESTESFELKKARFENRINALYGKLELEQKGLDFKVFKIAMIGHYNLKLQNQLGKDILSIADMSKSSTEKRLYVIDLENDKVLFHTYTSHGNGSGNEFAKSFSNKPNSYKTSIGWYVTNETYVGKHGVSLRLDGKDKGFNDKARERAIVMHGADYVSEQFIKNTGRLGRSQGCPALPMSQYKDIINTVKGKSSLFVYYPDEQYLKDCVYLDEEKVVTQLPL